MGHVHVARQGNAVFHGQHLCHDAHRNLCGCFAADVNTYRSAQTLEFFFRFVQMFDHAHMPRFVVAARAYGTDVKRIGIQCFQQSEIIELGVVRECDHAAAPVGSEALHHIVRHFAGDGDIRHRPSAPVLFARVAHGHCKPVEQCHGGQILSELTGADQQHAVFRAEGIHQLHFVNA